MTSRNGAAASSLFKESSKSNSEDDDFVQFADEEAPSDNKPKVFLARDSAAPDFGAAEWLKETSSEFAIVSENIAAWKILAVDDEPAVLRLTASALDEFSFLGRPAQVILASNASQAREILAQCKDIAVALLDVIMEEEDSGLKLVNHIRNNLGNHEIRIILRTGQAGLFSESNVMEQFDINGYLNKHDLTVTKLRTNLMAGFRSWHHLQEIRALQSSVKQLARKAALGDFAAGVFHDINTPLSIAVLQVHRALSVLESEDRQTLRKHLEKIAKAVDRMKEFSGSLLTHSKQTNETISKVTVLEAASELVSLCEPRLLQHSVAFEVGNIPSEVAVQVPKTSLIRVLMNLVNNACDALAACERRLIRFSCVTDGKRVRIRVSDSGPGIPHEIREKVFHSFFSTKSPDQGTGLGLSVSRGLLQNMGGDLSLLEDSELGGATFEVTLVDADVVS